LADTRASLASAPIRDRPSPDMTTKTAQALPEIAAKGARMAGQWLRAASACLAIFAPKDS